MKRITFYIMVVIVALVSACDKDENNNTPNQITMTTKKSVVHIAMAGSGTITINWGDGTKVETYTLLNFVDIEDWNNHFFDKYRYSHYYSGSSSCTITINGNNITHIDCYNNQLTSLIVNNNMLTFLVCYANQLTSLDVSNATNLTSLICGYNSLRSLDVSSNTKLISLSCYGNQLTNLNVNNNTALEFLHCKGNLLTNLNVSNNTVLHTLACQENNLSTEALNDLFSTLHNNTITGINKMVSIRDNPGTNSFTFGTVINGWLIDTML